jgi:hypothetical protein
VTNNESVLLDVFRLRIEREIVYVEHHIVLADYQVPALAQSLDIVKLHFVVAA